MRRLITLDKKKIEDYAALAPMAGVTDPPFRLLCKQNGAAFAVTEFVSANALARNIESAFEQAKVLKEEQPVIIQLFGDDIDNLIKSTKWANKQKCYAGIDINLGCPAGKVTRQGAGASLLADPKKIKILLKAVVEATKLPVSAKIRIGIDENSINAVEVAKIVENAGCAFITVHARTLKQGYRGCADWKYIKQVREAVKIPVIGNGDVKDAITAKQMIEETGCDYVMVGRAARNNPSIFKDINRYLKENKRAPQDKKLIGKYLKLAKKYKYDDFGQIRQHTVDMTKGFDGSAKLRQKLVPAQSIAELNKILTTFK